MNKEFTVVTAIKCDKCNTTIYSRSNHDFRWCNCKSIAVDGGFSYFRCSFTGNVPPTPFEVIINASKSELYEDYSSRKDKFGMIKNKKGK